MSDSASWAHVLVVGEPFEGSLSGASRELLGKGRELADSLGTYLWVYLEGEIEAGSIVRMGADRVFCNKRGMKTLTDRVKHLGALVQEHRPEILLAPSNGIWIGVLGRLAQRYQTGLVADCLGAEIQFEDRRLIAIKSLYGGRILSEWIWPASRPQIALFRPGIFPEPFDDPSRQGSVEEL